MSLNSDLLLVADTDTKEMSVVNLSQVRHVRLKDGQCNLSFSESYTVSITGKGALEVFLSLSAAGCRMEVPLPTLSLTSGLD